MGLLTVALPRLVTVPGPLRIEGWMPGLLPPTTEPLLLTGPGGGKSETVSAGVGLELATVCAAPAAYALGLDIGACRADGAALALTAAAAFCPLRLA